jgi:hypothetical protein
MKYLLSVYKKKIGPEFLFLRFRFSFSYGPLEFEFDTVWGHFVFRAVTFVLRCSTVYYDVYVFEVVMQ